jgi:hypothetical protein
MKFYKYNIKIDYWNKIYNEKLTCVFPYKKEETDFFNNGKHHNNRNAAYIRFDGFKVFHLNGIFYGFKKDFTKQSWRRFVKLQAFI